MTKTTLMPRTRAGEKLGLAPAQTSLRGTGLPFAGSVHSTFGYLPAIDAVRPAQVPPRDRPV